MFFRTVCDLAHGIAYMDQAHQGSVAVTVVLFHVTAFSTICLLAEGRRCGCSESRQRQCKAEVGIFALLKIGKPFCAGF